MLLLLGSTGFIGTLIIGRFLRLNFYATLIVIPLVMSAIAVMLGADGRSLPTTAALLGVWGMVGTAAPVGWWTWIAKTMPDDAEAGGGLMVAVVQLSIALGSSVGGLLYDRSGYQSTFAFSAILLLLGGILVIFTARADRAGAV